MKLELSRQILEKYSNFKTIRPVGAELFHADGRTDGRTDKHDEANSRFSQFCESALKMNSSRGMKPDIPILCPVRTRGTNIHRQTDDRKRCIEGNMNYELEFVVLVYFKALFQPSRIGIRFMAGNRIFDTAFRPAVVKVALSPRLIWPERKATHSLSYRVMIIDLWRHSPTRLRRDDIITGQQ
jgi:hypothetical protein